MIFKDVIRKTTALVYLLAIKNHPIRQKKEQIKLGTEAGAS